MKPFYCPALCAKLLDENSLHTDEEILVAMRGLKYPVLASLKLDGMRGIRLDHTLKSRTRKLIPNVAIRERSLVMPGGFDCELYNPALDFNTIQSIVMSQEHERFREIEFHVLDRYTPGVYYQRLDEVQGLMAGMPDCVKFVYPTHCANADELFAFFLKCEREDGEGICFRLPNSPYHQDYCTLNQQYLVKLARYVFAEAVIVGFEEQQVNCNPDKRNALGKMKRSSSQANKHGKDTLGAVWVTSTAGGDNQRFKVYSGFNDRERYEIWHNQSKYLGRQLVYKHKPHGRLNKPRSPVFHGWREIGF